MYIIGWILFGLAVGIVNANGHRHRMSVTTC